MNREEKAKADRFSGEHAEFSTYLMNNNIHVTFYTFVGGIVYGLGSILLLFYNGVGIGAVALDYISPGRADRFSAGMDSSPRCDRDSRKPRRRPGRPRSFSFYRCSGRVTAIPLGQRLRLVRSDLAMLVFGSAMMLVWAGIIESFLSQYHKPVLPYSAKITFGVVEFALLVWFLTMAGRKTDAAAKP